MNKYLNCYTLIADVYSNTENGLYIYVSQDDLTQWSDGLRLDFFPSEVEYPYYPYFVNISNNDGLLKGSVTECGQNAFLFYLGYSGSPNNKTSRIPVQFN